MIFIILFLAFFLRLVNLDQSLWLDEAVQAIISQDSFNSIFVELQGDFHPPLYHLFMWVWVHLFGSSEVVLRLPSVLFGTAAVWVIYLFAKRLTSEVAVGLLRGGALPWIAALFLATAPFHIYYSQEARPYVLVAFLVSLSFYFFLKRQWFWYIVVTTLAFYASYYVLFVLLAQGLAILVTERNQIVKLLNCQIVILILFLPLLPMLLEQIQTGQMALVSLPEWGGLVNAGFTKALPLTLIKFILGRITIFDKTLYGVVGVVLGVIYGMIIINGLIKFSTHLRGVLRDVPVGTSLRTPRRWPASWRDSSEVDRFTITITLWFIIPIVLAWLISLFTPNYQPFRLLFVLPAFYLLLAFGIFKFSNKTVKIFLVIFVLLVNLASLFTYYSNPYFHREDWRGVVQFIESQGNGVAVLPSTTSNWPWEYYSTGSANMIGISKQAAQVTERDLDNLTIEQFNNSTIFYIRYLQPLFDPQEKIMLWLANNDYVKIREISFNQIPVWEYESRR